MRIKITIVTRTVPQDNGTVLAAIISVVTWRLFGVPIYQREYLLQFYPVVAH